MKEEPGVDGTRYDGYTRERLIDEILSLRDHIEGLNPICREQNYPGQAPVPGGEETGIRPQQTEDALQRSEERFRSIVGIINEMIWETDDRFICIYASPKTMDILGYRTDEITGKKPSDFLLPDETGDIFTGFLQIYNTHQPVEHTEHRVRRKDGRIIVLETNGTPVFDDRDVFCGYRWVSRDITAQKDREEKLRLAQFSIDRANDMIFWVAPDGHFTYVNNAACRTLGYTREELLGKRVFDVNTLHNKRNWAEHRDELKRRGSLIFENTFITKDGREIPVELSVNYLFYRGQEYNCAAVRDITERKRAEVELKNAKDQVELYLDLMGHDINNMHQIALGYLEMARDVPADSGQIEFLDKSIEVLQRSARLIQNLRKLQKLREGVFRTDKVDVVKVLDSVHREFGAVPDKAVTLNLNGNKHCYVRANELLHDIFANLVSNAIKHTGDRADISINLDRVEVNDRTCCRVSVEDNGPGISDDLKNAIFNRMSKGSARAKGIGLGLYLVKSLAESFKGKTWVEDRTPGNHRGGARFVVMLPVT